jgi:hypothetical protein
MKLTMLPPVAILVIGTGFSVSLLAADWLAIDNPSELRALYANRTFKGKDWMDRPVITYYRADGAGLMLYKGTRIPVRWSVKGSDQVCVEWSAHKDCYLVQRHSTKTGTYRLIDVNTDVAAVYRIEDGIPNF